MTSTPTPTTLDLDALDLDMLQMLWGLTTPGEWTQSVLAIKCGYETVVHFGISNDFRPPRPHECESNATFVAAAHLYWPALIAKCREQEKEIERLQMKADELEEDVADLKKQKTRFVDKSQYMELSSLKKQLAAANERIKGLTTLLDSKLGTPCEQIRQQQDIEDRITRAICQETCAYKGEMPCWQMEGEFPPATCDEPGCLYLAQAAISALATKEQS